MMVSATSCFMNPWRLIGILENSDPSFQEIFYPTWLRCPLERRIVRAIEEHWPVYFPTRKECRGSSWSLSLPETEPPYKPRSGSLQELNAWKERISGTLAEGRAYRADVSWKRFYEICYKSPRLRPLLRDFKPVANFLMGEESMWPRPSGVAIGMEVYFQRQVQALLAPGSPYLLSDPERLLFLQSNRPTVEKIHMIDLMRRTFDRPLMVLAILQLCARESKNSLFWLDLQNHINAVIKTSSPLAFRNTWFEHAMQMSGSTKKSGESCPRQWARLLVSNKAPHLQNIDAKAIEINSWLKGKKQPSVETIRRTWQAIATAKHLPSKQTEAGNDRWLFSWMITLWLEDNYKEIARKFNGEDAKIQNFYRRFFDYIKIGHTALNGKWAGG
jgi:hypothetical protein